MRAKQSQSNYNKKQKTVCSHRVQCVWEDSHMQSPHHDDFNILKYFCKDFFPSFRSLFCENFYYFFGGFRRNSIIFNFYIRKAEVLVPTPLIKPCDIL